MSEPKMIKFISASPAPDFVWYGTPTAYNGDGVAFHSVAHPENMLAINIPEDISQDSIVTGTMMVDDGGRPHMVGDWTSEYSPGFLQNIEAKWEATFGPQPAVTPEMVAAGITAMLSHDDCHSDDADAKEVVGTYLAMKALEPVEMARSRDWEPSEDDLADMAMFLECLYHDVAYGRAPEPRDPRWHRIAAMVFDHPSYVPSIKAEWKALADQKVELVPLGELAALKERDEAILRADNEIKEAISEANQLRSELADYRSAIRPGCTHFPLGGASHLIWWPDSQSVPSFEPSGVSHEVASLRAQQAELQGLFEAKDRAWCEQATLIQGLKTELDTWIDHAKFVMKDRIALRAELSAIRTQASEPGNHDYNGPVVDGKTVPDEAHERFHRSVGDVLSGKIMPKAREQMREALGKSPPHAPTTASTGKPMPKEALGFGPQAIGIKLPI